MHIMHLVLLQFMHVDKLLVCKYHHIFYELNLAQRL